MHRCSAVLGPAVKLSRQLSPGAGTAGLKKTCLHDFHVSKGGKMVDFTGYSMPVQYEGEGIAASHLHTRYYTVCFFGFSQFLVLLVCIGTVTYIVYLAYQWYYIC